MLTEDSQARRAAKREEGLQQSAMDGHFQMASKDNQPEEKPKTYSDTLFREAAVQWLVETDQVHRVCLWKIDF
jgi:hypothetical protein